jgi:putative transposase
MPRIARNAPAGVAQHVLNRGNGRQRLFFKPADYDAFLHLLADALEKVPGVLLLGFCLMPNHWHLVLLPTREGALSEFMRWLSNTHVRRWHRHRHSDGQGHVYQGRFKNFPVQDDDHLLIVLRYVESNPIRGRSPLVALAQLWRWSSLGTSLAPDGRRLVAERSKQPVSRPRNWKELVNAALPEVQLEQVREALRRGRPFGEEEWVQRTAKRLGLEFTLRPRGRPRKTTVKGKR